MRKFIKSFFKWLFVGVFLAIVITVVGEFFVKAAEQKGVYDNAGQQVDSVITESASFLYSALEFVTSLPFRIGIMSLISFGVGLYGAMFLIKRDDKKKLEEEEQEFLEEGNKDKDRERLFLPSHQQVFANILNSTNLFTLQEAAQIMVDRRISGELSNAASSQMVQLQKMMRSGEIERQSLTPMEAMASYKTHSFTQMVMTGERPLPPVSSKINRKQLFELTKKLQLPVPGLKP